MPQNPKIPVTIGRLILMQLILAVTLLLPDTGVAQQTNNTLNGIVLKLDSGEPLQYVEITNINTGTATESDEKGNFSIKASKNERLRFEYPGYRTDTLVIIEFDLKRVYLTPDGSAILIDEVRIEALSDNQLATEIERAKREGQIAEASQHRGGIRISPSRWFGQRGKQARQRYELLLAEQERRKIDSRFTPQLITSLTPLSGQQLGLYMTKYRPTVDFISSANDEALRLYIMDTYAAFKKLTPAELSEIKAPTEDQ
ncbi:carboxypeptidase-like regulatory domain-containing protein [Parapedobacter lycopersici]|uniref:carboxypeptidase-like regulatory domain-containing protein n=1 Tax=Parapedobacter lycopersici TaxID=1864939 RepID=UPI00214DA413|nr:carboxypeptidase-like regulatory domain-containing protein [Parapedobacter lycopersici]